MCFTGTVDSRSAFKLATALLAIPVFLLVYLQDAGNQPHREQSVDGRGMDFLDRLLSAFGMSDRMCVQRGLGTFRPKPGINGQRLHPPEIERPLALRAANADQGSGNARGEEPTFEMEFGIQSKYPFVKARPLS